MLSGGTNVLQQYIPRTRFRASSPQDAPRVPLLKRIDNCRLGCVDPIVTWVGKHSVQISLEANQIGQVFKNVAGQDQGSGKAFDGDVLQLESVVESIQRD